MFYLCSVGFYLCNGTILCNAIGLCNGIILCNDTIYLIYIDLCVTDKKKMCVHVYNK